MRRLGVLALVLMLGGGMYLASPFFAAWTLRHAIKNGDTATIEQKVVWSSVRESLRTSIARHQRLLPEINDIGAKIDPTIWQRVRSAFGTSGRPALWPSR